MLFLQFLFKPDAHFKATHNTHTKHHPISISLQVDFSFLWTALSSYSFHKEPEESHVPFVAVQSQTLRQQQVHFHLGIQFKCKDFKDNGMINPHVFPLVSDRTVLHALCLVPSSARIKHKIAAEAAGHLLGFSWATEVTKASIPPQIFFPSNQRTHLCNFSQ